MKLIKPGPKYEPQERTCNGCESVVLVELSDLRYHTDDDYRGGGGESYYYAHCCACKSRIVIPEDSIPYGAQMGHQELFGGDMTDLETMKAMLIKAGIDFNEETVVVPLPRTHLTIEGGYSGFYSILSFNPDDSLEDVEAYE